MRHISRTTAARLRRRRTVRREQQARRTRLPGTPTPIPERQMPQLLQLR